MTTAIPVQRLNFFNRPYREDRFHIHFLNCSRAAFYEPALGHRLSNIFIVVVLSNRRIGQYFSNY